MPVIRIPYSPRPQIAEFHRRLERFACVVAHRRFGKTYLNINDMLRKATENTREFPPPMYAYISPLQKQSKKNTWKYWKHFAGKIPGVKFNETEASITLPNGAVIFVLGADNPDALRGDYLDGAVLDEFGDMRPSVLPEVVMPMLADYKGWLTIIGTAKGRNQFYDIRVLAEKSKKWFFKMLKASDTGIIGEEELEQQKEIMTEAQYEQEFECSFNAVVAGAYYGQLMAEADKENRIRTYNYDRSKPVHTAWDIGVGDSTAIWFAQWIDGQLHLIDYYEASGHGAEHYVQVLQRKPYIYGNHYLPHDVRVREWGGGKTRVETLTSLGVRPTIVPQLTVDDGINACRLALPHCVFHETNTSQGIESLRYYHSEIDDKKSRSNDRPHLKPVPVHDWASHGADAFRYLCIAWEQHCGTLEQTPRGIENCTMDELIAMDKNYDITDGKV